MIYYLDASAWVKYYVREGSSPWVEAFWDKTPMCARSVLGPIEVMAAIRRRISPGKTQLEPIFAEVCRQFQGFQAIPLSLEILQISQRMIVRHALRGADLVHLSSMIYLQHLLEEPITLVASDAELLNAAVAEGIATMDPATTVC